MSNTWLSSHSEIRSAFPSPSLILTLTSDHVWRIQSVSRFTQTECWLQKTVSISWTILKLQKARRIHRCDGLLPILVICNHYYSSCSSLKQPQLQGGHPHWTFPPCSTIPSLRIRKTCGSVVEASPISKGSKQYLPNKKLMVKRWMPSAISKCINININI